MIALLATPVVLVLAVLAAHFWRAGDFALAIVSVVLIGLVFVRRPWAARSLQLVLVLGALEWLRTLAALVAMRQATGTPFARLALILGVVALATAVCALLFELRAMRERYRR